VNPTVKKLAAEVVSIGVAVAAVLAVAVNLAPSLHLPAGTIAILSTISGVLALVVNAARQIAGEKMAARRAAKVIK
jgi:uncharacterized integral membrane protein